MREINSDSFEEEVQNSEQDVVLSFTASWCGFCKNTQKMLSVAEKEIKNVKFLSADIEKTPDLAKRYNVRGVPTTLYFSKGVMKNRRTGALTKSEVYALAERNP